MNEMNFNQRLLSQNFLTDPKLVAFLVDIANFKQSDVIVDVGAGRGAITGELAKVASKVIAIELDSSLANQLKAKFAELKNVEIYNEDVLQFALPKVPYKVFSNVPFHITADLIHKLVHFASPPQEAYLVVQKEAALKYVGSPKETLASVSLKPWFTFSIVHSFQKSDFSPSPGVDSVLLRCVTNECPSISNDDKLLYTKFLKYSFTHGRDLKSGLQKVFSYEQWKRLAKSNNFPIHIRATDLNFTQWLSLFRYLRQDVDPAKYTILL